MATKIRYSADKERPLVLRVTLQTEEDKDDIVVATDVVAEAANMETAKQIADALQLAADIAPEKESPLAELKKTGRGFELLEFEDLYGAKCSLQESSLAGQAAIWLGVDDATPQIMKSDAQRRGMQLPPGEVSGWMPYPIPKEVLLTTRMHLNESLVRQLMWRLGRWLKNNSFSA